MPHRPELDTLGTSIDGPSAPTLVKVGRWYSSTIKHERLPSRVTHNDYDRWRRVGVRALAKAIVSVSMVVTAVALPIRCAYDRAQEECKDYVSTDFGDTPFEAYEATSGVLVSLHGYKPQELLDAYEAGDTIRRCDYQSIHNLDAIAKDFRLSIGEFATTTTTTQPS